MTDFEEKPTVVESPSVHDLIVAHQGDRSNFARLRAEFEKNQGRILEEYYALNFPAALLLVAQRRPGWPPRVVHKTRLFYDPSRSTPEFDDVFRSARQVERKYAVLLHGRVQEILTQGSYTTGAHLLAVLDAMSAPEAPPEQKPGRISSAAASAKKETKQIERYAYVAAMKSALIRYLSGIFVGAIVVALCVYFADFVPLTVENGAPVAVCLACGGIGAIVSVMVRITNRRKVQVGIDQGRFVTVLSGAFRSIIGAVFGAVLFVLVAGGLIPIATPGAADQVSLFFAGLAFLAGFSERWAQDTIVRTLPGTPDTADPRITDAGPGKDG
ncbi:hypothetical protein ACGFMK_32725 [Amycolatopsis sp. NPDC049252]|uniref:hypothetical protein n=1 Tax=Amycolatopsis sp. NPDC049252 TaxID=3363933 RepID=UPI00371D4045